jgi:hypothetical protein
MQKQVSQHNKNWDKETASTRGVALRRNWRPSSDRWPTSALMASCILTQCIKFVIITTVISLTKV